jgi:hypothetical protein
MESNACGFSFEGGMGLGIGIGNWELCAWNALSLEQVRDTSLNPLFCPFEIFLAYLICFYP